jgi:hypothetical protein
MNRRRLARKSRQKPTSARSIPRPPSSRSQYSPQAAEQGRLLRAASGPGLRGRLGLACSLAQVGGDVALKGIEVAIVQAHRSSLLQGVRSHSDSRKNGLLGRRGQPGPRRRRAVRRRILGSRHNQDRRRRPRCASTEAGNSGGLRRGSTCPLNTPINADITRLACRARRDKELLIRKLDFLEVLVFR